jgi:O-antigen ligase
VTAISRKLDKYVLGITLFVGLTIGGGTRPGLVTDSIVEVIAILSAAFVLSGPASAPISRSVKLMCAAIIAVMVLQIIPLPIAVLNPFRGEIIQQALESAAGTASTSFITLGFGRTMEAMIFMIAVLGFFLAVLRLQPEKVVELIPFFLLGVVCNIIAGAIQFSISEEVAIEGLLSYKITAGLFANINHFSTLLFITIPFLVYFGIIKGALKIGLAGLVAILIMLLAAGSRAGVAIGLMITVLSLFFLSARSRLGSSLVVLLFGALSFYGMQVWTRFEARELDREFGRLEFARTTLAGIWDNWLLGVGYGTFERAYQIYERPEMIFRVYVNHAHNDYLEIIFEGGIIAAFLIAVYLILVHVQVWRHRGDALRKVAYLSMLFILLHSLVDYPMRTIGLALTFAFLNAILFHSGSFVRTISRDRAVEVDVDGERLVVPVASEGRRSSRRRRAS